MLLTYLYQNFLEEDHFAASAGFTIQELQALINAKVFPEASYVYYASAEATSFLGEFRDKQPYRFHLKGHTIWLHNVVSLGLRDEKHARDYFFARYNAARQAFAGGELYRQLSPLVPDVLKRFDQHHADATWQHFLHGVYGVCTRDGRPETVFQKQIGVMIIDHLIAEESEERDATQTAQLKEMVDFLDIAESDFAPHEVRHSSRQRCIIDVRDRFLA
ncbi:DUF6058 family natural product biosynthesis protein [Gymnodinialimonas sp. 2305UL16-5]|uniref:DUF6058 family natural product biosynthesis protein n=1 Tax=Gymnodinialimonas mytili TaxID=3126503 RepID=UPI0030A91075